MTPVQPTTRSRATSLAIALILAAYLCARLLEIAPTPISAHCHRGPRRPLRHGLCIPRWRTPLLHARHPGLRRNLALVGNLVENMGVSTGFPFGRYYFWS